MPDSADARVAVYIDFDNIVISRYKDQHPEHEKDQLNRFTGQDKAMGERLELAKVNFGAILDYASSFGTIVISRAYADWSLPVNSRYQRDLVSRAVDLTQLFSTAGTKNGADIRLAIDVVEDLFRLPSITHVLIVAGDSDYISLAQRTKRLDRYVVGIGVAGSTSSSLSAACDQFTYYGDLPGIEPLASPNTAIDAAASGVAQRTPSKSSPVHTLDPALQSKRDKAAALLEMALRLGHEKDEAVWLHSAAVKNQMKRIDPEFNEKTLGYSTFTDFLETRPKLVEIREEGLARMLRLKKPPKTEVSKSAGTKS